MMIYNTNTKLMLKMYDILLNAVKTHANCSRFEQRDKYFAMPIYFSYIIFVHSIGAAMVFPFNVVAMCFGIMHAISNHKFKNPNQNNSVCLDVSIGSPSACMAIRRK